MTGLVARGVAAPLDCSDPPRSKSASAHWSYYVCLSAAIVGGLIALAALVMELVLAFFAGLTLAVTDSIAAYKIKKYSLLEKIDYYNDQLEDQVDQVEQQVDELQEGVKQLEVTKEEFKKSQQKWERTTQQHGRQVELLSPKVTELSQALLRLEKAVSRRKK